MEKNGHILVSLKEEFNEGKCVDDIFEFDEEIKNGLNGDKDLKDFFYEVMEDSKNYSYISVFHFLKKYFEKKGNKSLQEIAENQYKNIAASAGLKNIKLDYYLCHLMKHSNYNFDSFINNLLKHCLNLLAPYNWGVKYIPIFDLERIRRTLNLNFRKGIAIIGNTGTGKTHLINHLIKFIFGDENCFLLNKKEFLNPRKEFSSDNAKKFMDALESAVNNNKIIIIDNINILKNAYFYWEYKYISPVDILARFLLNENTRIVVTCTPTFNFSGLDSKDYWMEYIDFFNMPLPSKDQLIQVLQSHIDVLKEFVEISDEDTLIKNAISNGSSIYPAFSSPGCNVMYLWEYAQYYDKGEKDSECFSIYMAEPEKKDFEKLNNTLKENIIGQDEVIDKIIERLKITRDKYDINPNRPDGIFLLMGPSGVGKTEIARIVSKWLNGENIPLLKIDMGQYKAECNISGLIGITAGYVGYDDVPLLTRYLSLRKDIVILLDEIEKAHPRVLDLFLSIFDEGKIMDARGNLLDFSSSIFFMTSNVGAELWDKKMETGFKIDDKKKKEDLIETKELKESLINSFFKPEFLNRIDAILVLKPLDKDSLKKIARLNINKYEKIFKDKLGIKGMIYEDNLIDYLVEKDKAENGARYLIRNIEEYFNKIMSFILNNKDEFLAKSINLKNIDNISPV